MNKQYFCREHTAVTHIVEEYRDGVLYKYKKVKDVDLDEYLDKLEAEGYKCAINRRAAMR